MLTTLSIMQKQPNIFGEEKTCLQDKLTRTAPNALKADFQSSHEASCEDWKSAFKAFGAVRVNLSCKQVFSSPKIFGCFCMMLNVVNMHFYDRTTRYLLLQTL